MSLLKHYWNKIKLVFSYEFLFFLHSRPETWRLYICWSCQKRVSIIEQYKVRGKIKSALLCSKLGTSMEIFLFISVFENAKNCKFLSQNFLFSRKQPQKISKESPPPYNFRAAVSGKKKYTFIMKLMLLVVHQNSWF